MKKSLLKSKLKQIFLKHKLSKNHAEICSNYLVKAEILDAKGHGLARLKMYCDRIKAKVINPKPKIKIKKISSSVSYIDADNSIGFVSADIGIKQAIKNAKKTGIGLVAIKKSGHYGLSSFYAEQAVNNKLMVFVSLMHPLPYRLMVQKNLSLALTLFALGFQQEEFLLYLMPQHQ